MLNVVKHLIAKLHHPTFKKKLFIKCARSLELVLNSFYFNVNYFTMLTIPHFVICVSSIMVHIMFCHHIKSFICKRLPAPLSQSFLHSFISLMIMIDTV